MLMASNLPATERWMFLYSCWNHRLECNIDSDPAKRELGSPHILAFTFLLGVRREMAEVFRGRATKMALLDPSSHNRKTRIRFQATHPAATTISSFSSVSSKNFEAPQQNDRRCRV